MSENRWQRVEDIFHRAVALPPDARAAFLDEACAADQSLRREVESLLAHESKDGATFAPARDAWIPSRFSLERTLGAGGFGVVYQAFDHKRNARVALKTLSVADPLRLYYLKQEFRSLAGVVHPNLVTLFELLEEDGKWFFTMELIEGKDFLEHTHRASRPESRTVLPTVSMDRFPAPDSTIPSVGTAEAAIEYPIDYDNLRGLLGQLIAGLSALHRMGKLHRDIKPSNVLVDGSGRVVLLDFGLVADSDLGPHPATIAGTPNYMAPELSRGKQTEASDWYSVGVMLHKCLTGRYPEPGGESQLNGCQAIPADFKDLCLSLLRIDPTERPSGARLLVDWGGEPVGFQGSRHRFVGRSAELAQLWQAHRSTSSGRVAAVRVSGSSGIGKSALLKQFQRELRQREPGVVQISVRCFEQESMRYKAFDGVVDEISRWLTQLSPVEAEWYLPSDFPALVRVFPVLRSVRSVTYRVGQVVDETWDGQEQRRRAFEALRELLSRIAAVKPVAVFIDDLQWSDLDSVPIFHSLLREPGAPPILLVAAYRAEEAGSRMMSELTPMLGAAGGCEIRLGVLTDEESQALALVLGSGTRAAAVAREAAGNPFLIDALLRHTGEMSAGVTPTLEQVIERQVSHLPDPGRLLLELLVTAGHPLGSDMLRGRADPKLLALLAAERLVRSRGSGEEMEPYHDRIRETVAKRIPAAQARAHHLWLAQAFASRENVEPETVALHFRGAGDPVSAFPYAAMAAERAMETLAFNQAATLFGIALEHPDLPPEKARPLRRRLGDALTDLGRAPEAAAAYRAATAGAPTAERIELLRLAGERLLVSGQFDEGYETMRQVLGTVGMRFQATPIEAVVSMIWRRIFLRFRGLRFKARPAALICERRLQMVDVCESMVGGLAPIDPVRAMDFQARLTMQALRAGDPVRMARALALEAIVSSTGGSQTLKLTDSTMSEAEKLVELTGDAAAKYLLASASGMSSFFAGRFEEALVRMGAASRMKPPVGGGSSWIIMTMRHSTMVCWLYTGDLVSLREHLPGMISDSRGRGDLAAETNMRCRYAHVLLLAAGQPEKVEAEIDDAIARWSQKAYHLQHYFALLALIESELYRGDPQAAWNRLQAKWPVLTRSLIFRIQLISIEARHLHARVALALAAAGESAPPLLRQALEDAKAIERAKVGWGKGFALLIRAGVEHTSGRNALELLAQAESTLGASGMRLFAAAAGRRRGELGGEPARVRAADEWMASQGIVEPANFTKVLAPGLDSKR